MPQHRGSCHCGANQVLLDTPRLPQDQIIGACQCSFCRKHGVRTVADPEGFAEIRASDASALARGLAMRRLRAEISPAPRKG